jgi:hypothetical protein
MSLSDSPRTTAQALARVPEHVLPQELEGEIVVLELESGAYYGLNEVGARIWLLIQKYETLEEVLEALLKEYDTDEATLRGDLQKYIQVLAEAKLVVLRNGKSSQAV